jgi:hypothetical protein
VTVADVARLVGGLLAEGAEDDALRFLLDGVNPIATMDEADMPPYLEEPPTTGDERWDALIAASVAHLCRRRGATPPGWTRRDSLPQWWWPGHARARRALIVQRTPIDFRRLGIWFDERNFHTA